MPVPSLLCILVVSATSAQFADVKHTRLPFAEGLAAEMGTEADDALTLELDCVSTA